ncbi:NAD-dependent epimerase/dehydratase family protein [Streptomyces sp. A7024]|uniref:NAD-dependent epimerase/dehydratase family protein n=1 Tax=Streptomyces coryli TaxID=1128680 RepID=A0A6G4U2I5_9ACTN|nr:NAD-dependent epimerase/dehydratase family protein [Streptomyces coryli]NGN65497.1 NAD-dependent epimerase/dehydratase family protein [Streptomyces coryli]
MRLLILGGTAFVGRAIVADALRSGHEVTLFGRGKTGNDLFPEAERLIGDRDTGDYDALRAAGRWDAVVDVSGYVPRHVGQAMDALGDRAGRYLFISSGAVYALDGLAPDSDEDAARVPPVRDTEVVGGKTYGGLKVACEDDVTARYGERATVARPGRVAGPYDPFDAFTYWVRRAARGGRVAVPGDPAQPVQVVDVRDVGRLVVRLLEDERGGAFHAVGPAEPTTLGGLIRTCAEVAGSEVELVPVELAPEDVPGWPGFPLVRPHWPSSQRSPAKARAAGMPATPLARTAADVLAWDRERGRPPLTEGFTEEQEARVLARVTP